ncbi:MULTISPECIES: hypothetical protein [Paraburkholderia]|uniref:Uncharacterized protein n=1 Tax=Paraburkholderia metrosideri TaxID=580937 RepID=A0ABW9E4Z6_9BURK
MRLEEAASGGARVVINLPALPMPMPMPWPWPLKTPMPQDAVHRV